MTFLPSSDKRDWVKTVLKMVRMETNTLFADVHKNTCDQLARTIQIVKDICATLETESGKDKEMDKVNDKLDRPDAVQQTIGTDSTAEKQEVKDSTAVAAASTAHAADRERKDSASLAPLRPQSWRKALVQLRAKFPAQQIFEDNTGGINTTSTNNNGKGAGLYIRLVEMRKRLELNMELQEKKYSAARPRFHFDAVGFEPDFNSEELSALQIDNNQETAEELDLLSLISPSNYSVINMYSPEPALQLESYSRSLDNIFAGARNGLGEDSNNEEYDFFDENSQVSLL
jgi:hypothetical protein